jgi:hypothetical protein
MCCLHSAVSICQLLLLLQLLLLRLLLLLLLLAACWLLVSVLKVFVRLVSASHVSA